MNWRKQVGKKKNKIKIRLLFKIIIFIHMGRPKKEEKDKKIKIGITLDRKLFNKIKTDKLKPSRIIEKLVKDYYANKNLQ